MLIAPTYTEVLERLTDAFRHRYDDAGDSSVRLAGILLARPSSPLAKAEIVPSLDDFHHRSGDHIDFFLPGYCLGPEPDDPEFPCQRVLGSRGDFWVFSPQLFDGFRKELEGLTRWQYSGGTELFLVNAAYDGEQASLDFGSSLVCQLDSMKRDGAIDSVETFFERVFRFAEESKGVDPAWGFSDSEGKRVAGSALRSLVLSLVPKEIANDAKRAVHLVARNLQR